MSTAVTHMSTYQSQLPASQSAPILKFRCQFTHDLSRKKKRWQDGFCDFHTYNKKAMVYDKERITVGGMHWKESDTLQQDDEFTLDQEGLLVRVDEPMGQAVADLRPLIEHRVKTHEGRTPHIPARSSMMIRREVPSPATPGPTDNRHRSIASLLPGLRNPIGRAALPESPYEQRQRDKENNDDGQRSPKRRRIEPFSITKTTTPRPKKPVAPLVAKGTLANTAKKTSAKAQTIRTASQKQLPVRECIDLISDSPTNDGETFTPLTQLEHQSSSPQVRMSPPLPPVFAPRPKAPVGRAAPSAAQLLPKRSRVPSREPSLEPRENRASSTGNREQIPKAGTALRIAKSASRPKLLCQTGSKISRVLRDIHGPEVSSIDRSAKDEDGHTVLRRHVRKVRGEQGIPVFDNGLSDTIQSSIPELRDTVRSLHQTSPVLEKRLHKRKQVAATIGVNRSRSSSPAFCTLTRDKPQLNGAAVAKQGQEHSTKHSRTAARQAVVGRISSPDVVTNLDDHIGIDDKRTMPRQPRRPTKAAALDARRIVSSIPDPVFKTAPLSRHGDLPSRRQGPIRRVVSAADAELALASTNAFDSSHIDDEDELPDPPSRTMFKRTGAATLGRPKRPAIQRASSDVTQVESLRRATSLVKQSILLNRDPLVPPKPVRSKHIGPWTIEATDLFDWRPPDWEERLRKMNEV